MATLLKCKMVVLGCNPRFFSTTSQRLSQRYVYVFQLCMSVYVMIGYDGMRKDMMMCFQF